jgi:hypothetical protein
MPRRKKSQDELEIREERPPQSRSQDVEERAGAYAAPDEEYYEEEQVEEYDEEQLAAVEAEVEEAPADPRRTPMVLMEEEEEEEERVLRHETRQQMLGRLMHQLLSARERVHESLEQVRDINSQMRDAGPRPSEKAKEQYHRAVSSLSAARRDENMARSELIQVLNWRG